MIDNQKHNKKKLIIRWVGISLLAIGAVCALTGFIDFFIAFNEMGEPKLFFMAFIGLPLVGIGLFLTIFSFTREIRKYVKDENVPIHKEFYHDMKPEIKDLVDTIKSEPGDAPNNYCSNCGAKLDKDDKFCPNCGKKVE